MSLEETDDLHFVGKAEDLVLSKRSVVTVEGRDVLLIHHQGEFYALDCYCYHAGTSLETGDIEELNSKLCIICPKHKYKISLSEGEGLYRARDTSLTPPRVRWFSKGPKQRVHQLSLIQGALYLRLSSRGRLESDYYQGERGKVEREKAERAEDTGAEEGRGWSWSRSNETEEGAGLELEP
ncbi:hypothetical protein WMY93_031535 [Mugilogobius chulae]|uniref:Rieske domain-containing protein n=1 Tax=Mugilogobius chulae TaxID=88201 RepID=A0AAW0MFV3_9GOBI